MSRIAIFIPGIMGSELWLEKQLIWPGGIPDLIFRYPYVSDAAGTLAQGDELLSQKLHVGSVIRRVSVSSQYEHLLSTLAQCGFHEGETLYLYPYDWRKSNAESAEGLAVLVDKIRDERATDANLEIFLIAHSMGGLVSRFYLESGKFLTRQGFRFVSFLICLATPHHGSPLALTAALGMERRVFLQPDQVYKLTRQSEFPSLYQLLPPRGVPFAWNRELKEKLMPVDIYEIADSLTDPNSQCQLNLDNLKSAVEFHQSLDVSRKPDSVRYFFFAGTRQRSATASLIIPAGSSLEVQNREVDDGGDGTVPFWSASISRVQGAPVGGEHGTIYKNEELRVILMALIGQRDALAASSLAPELAVRDHVVSPDSKLHLTLDFGAGTQKVSGEIRIEKLKDPDAKTYVQAMPASRIAYGGSAVERFHVLLRAPAVNGIYRVAFYFDGELVSAAADDLFVQASIALKDVAGL